MNKTATILLALLIGISSFPLAKNPVKQSIDSPMDNKVQFLQEGTYRQVPMNIVRERLQAPTRHNNNDLVPLDRVNRSKNPNGPVRDGLWDLTHVDDFAEWYLGSGDQNDTMAVAFTPAAPCIVREVYHQWFDGGNVIAFGAMLSDVAIENTTNGASTDWPRGWAPWSPIGELMTPATPNTIEDYLDDWSIQLDIGIVGDEFIVGDSTDINSVETFLIVIVKGGETPHPLASDVPDETYLWFGGPWTDPDGDISTPDGDWGPGYAWGSYQSSASMADGLIDNMVLVKVEYPWGAPLAIQSISQLNNTYDQGLFMPPPPGNTLTVYTDLFDDVDDASGMAIDDNDVVTAHYSFQGTTNDVELTANDVGADGNGIYTFEIFYANASPGDVIEYWITATDNDGLASESMHMSFQIKEPSNPDADLLVIRDRVSDRQRDLVEQVLDDNNFVYEVWDTFLENGIDGSVINHGWTNIIAYGWGNATIPVIADDPLGGDPGYSGFINGGGNLLLIDMDWFYGHNLDPELTFSSGDFAYDYFGIAGGLNDPPAIDTIEVTGVGVTAIDNPFTVTPMTVRHGPYLIADGMGWTDHITAGDGTPIFYDNFGNLVGIFKDHDPGGEAVYLSFMADAAGDTTETGEWIYTEFAQLIEGALAEFGIASPPAINLVGEGSTRYGVASGTSSATVNATCFDSDGELTSVVLKYFVDEGEVVEVNMVPGEGIAYSATFDIEGFSDASTVTYWAEATDDAGFNTGSGVGEFWGTSFVSSGASVLYMRDHNEPYDDYGCAYADSILRVNMESVGIDDYDTWVVWDNGSADYVSVLSNYTSVIYAGVLDWTPMPYSTADNSLSEFVAGGGYMLFSSEEVLGTLTDWVDASFSTGDFVYDVLGVEWVGNDYAYIEVAAGDDGGTGLIAGLPAEDIPLDASFMTATGSMADLCDPIGYDTPDELPVPFNADYLGEDNYYYASSINGNVIFMAFNISMLPNAEQQTLLANFDNWVGGGSGPGSIDVENMSGWNLVGLPLEVVDASYNTVFPSSISGSLYGFNGTYVNESDLVEGLGYWLRFSDSGSTTITGSVISSLTVGLSQGWNLISGISEAVDVASISDPDGIIVPGSLYGFTGTYASSSELTPGKGYWLRTSASGDITISGGASARTTASFTDQTKDANILSFNGSELYFGISIPEENILSYQLPPKPPVGAFDVRFADDMKVAGTEGAIDVMNNTDRLTISYTINIDAGEHLRWVLTSDEGKEYELNDFGEILVSGDVTGFTLNKASSVPLKFAVSQNYPNPFNPVTSISYEIPEESFVTISVYNLVGQKVTDLVHELSSVGYHRTLWNGTNMAGDPVSSGVYIYTIEADNYRTVKKMILMK